MLRAWHAADIQDKGFWLFPPCGSKYCLAYVYVASHTLLMAVRLKKSRTEFTLVLGLFNIAQSVQLNQTSEIGAKHHGILLFACQ